MPTYSLAKPSTSPAAAFQPNGLAPFGQQTSLPQGAAMTKPGAPRAAGTSATTSNFRAPSSDPFAQSPLQSPGNNLTNPGYGEQALEYTQNRLLNDPAAGQLQNQYQQTQTGQPGEQYINQNLGTLDGPGQGDQYWNQVNGQFMDPFAGEQFAREATQNFAAQGPASAFYNQSMGQYGDFTGYSGPQNSQGQYGASSSALANGTQGEGGLGQLAGQYGSIGQYSGPNLAAGQYAQTQGAFGAMPIANFDPFYDRARQLGVQDYNRQAAGRGVYGSSEALSGVGNVITDIEAQRANRSFDAEMQRAQEQRARQELLGNQARMGDLSSLAAFDSNLKGVSTFGDINNQMGQLEISRHQTLGQLANNADSQALGAQNANISGLNAFANISSNADSAEARRYESTTNAMNQADRTGLDRLKAGADIANNVDTGNREDFRASTQAANNAAQLGIDRTRLGAEIANNASANDLARLQTFNNTAQGAEGQRQARQTAQQEAQFRQTDQMLQRLGMSMKDLTDMGQEEAEQVLQAQVVPALQAAGWDQKRIDEFLAVANEGLRASASG